MKGYGPARLVVLAAAVLAIAVAGSAIAGPGPGAESAGKLKRALKTAKKAKRKSKKAIRIARATSKQEGPQGPQGTPGEQGPQGDLGPQGPEGPPGFTAADATNATNNVDFQFADGTQVFGSVSITITEQSRILASASLELDPFDQDEAVQCSLQEKESAETIFTDFSRDYNQYLSKGTSSAGTNLALVGGTDVLDPGTYVIRLRCVAFGTNDGDTTRDNSDLIAWAVAA